jgi:hypothetical protein
MWTRYFAPVLSLALLLGVVTQKNSYAKPEDAIPYHQFIKELEKEIPFVINDWVGSDTGVPPAAVALLKPNLLISRRYINGATGQVASLLIVQCGDSRDMVGHYPPRCYPAHGMVQRDNHFKQRVVEGVEIPFTQYEFASMSLGETVDLIVNNFIVLPDGRIMPDIDGMASMAADYQKRFLGAAQVQIVVEATVPASDEERIFNELVGANIKLIQAMRLGVKP